MVFFFPLNSIKGFHKIIFLFIVRLSLISCELRFVLTIFRHGARSPMAEGVDFLGEKWDTYLQLTDVGIRQMYLLGTKNRKKYSSFLSSTYNPKEICAFSSNWNRTILSANAYLQGLFPFNLGSQISNEKLKNSNPPVSVSELADEMEKLNSYPLPYGMQIIPVGIIPEKDRLNTFYNSCPNSRGLLESNMANENIQNFVKEFNSNYKEKITKALSIEDKELFLNFKNIVRFFGVFYSDYVDNRKMNTLRDSGIDFEELNKTAFNSFILDNFEFFAGNKDFNNIFSSPFLQIISSYMKGRVDSDNQNKFEYTSSNPKMIIYSLHDYDITSLIATIQDFFDLPKEHYYPSFASSLTFELDFDQTNKKFVIHLLFNDENIADINYENFVATIPSKSLPQRQINLICHGTEELSTGSINYYLFFTIIFGLIAILEFILIYRKLRRSKHKHFVEFQKKETALL